MSHCFCVTEIVCWMCGQNLRMPEPIPPEYQFDGKGRCLVVVNSRYFQFDWILTAVYDERIYYFLFTFNRNQIVSPVIQCVLHLISFQSLGY